MTKMKAIGFTEHLPISDRNSFQEFTEDVPSPEGHDLLVKIISTSVNPVDIGVRSGHGKLEQPKVIGWDTYGTVTQVGKHVSLFNVGDKVFYAGSFIRPGSDSQYQLVDERIVGHAPTTLKAADIGGMALTSLTAWEALFERLEIDPADKEQNANKTILIINGSGGVGSIATQLAHMAGFKVIATASRPETIKWVKQNGADYTANHRKIDLQRLTKKSASFNWEWMYTKSYYHTDDMITQHEILDKVAELLDKHVIHPTVTKTFKPINVANLKKATELVETNHMIGKVTISNE